MFNRSRAMIGVAMAMLGAGLTPNVPPGFNAGQVTPRIAPEPEPSRRKGGDARRPSGAAAAKRKARKLRNVRARSAK